MKSIKELRINDKYMMHLDALTGEAYLFTPEERPESSLRADERQVKLAERLSGLGEELCQKHKTYAFVVDTACNYNCEFCYEDHNEKKSSTSLSAEQVKNIFAIIDRGEKHPTRLTLFGGEPLLEKNYSIVEMILKMGSQRGYGFFIPTNGYSLDKYIDLLTSTKNVRVQITLDDLAEKYNQKRRMGAESNPFAKVVANIDQALEQGMRIAIRANIDENNVEDVPELVRFMEERGWFAKKLHLYFTPLRKARGRCFQWFAESLLKRLLAVWPEGTPQLTNELFVKLFGPEGFRMQYYGCNACYMQYFFLGNGDIYPCAESIGNERFKIGTYDTELHFNEMYTQLLQRNALQLTGKCRDCDDLLFCGGGCPYRVLVETGELQRGDCGSRLEAEHYLRYFGQAQIDEAVRNAALQK